MPLSFDEAFRSLGGGEIQPAYWLLPGEPALISRFEKRLAGRLLDPAWSAISQHVVAEAEDPLAEAVMMAETAGLGGGRLIIVRGEVKPGLPGDERMLEYLAQPMPGCCILLAGVAADRRSRLFKRFEQMGLAVSCDPPDAGGLRRWLAAELRRREVRMDGAAADLLLSRAGSDLTRLEQELDKLELAAEEGVISEAAVASLVAPALEESVFGMLDALGERRLPEALALLDGLLQKGEPALRLLFMVARHLRMMLQAKDLARRGHDARSIAARIKEHPYAVRKALAQSRRFDAVELRRGLTACYESELAVKQGRMQERLALELVLLALQKKEERASPGASSRA